MSMADEFPNEAAVEYNPEDDLPSSEAERVARSNEAKLFDMPDVTGVGVGQNAIGEDAIVVYLRHAGAASQIPKQLDGIDVVTEVTGEIEAN